MHSKDEIRKKAKALRKKLDIQKISDIIIKNLISLDEYKKAKIIFCYNSFGDEICTQELFKDSAKNWLIPKVEGDNLLICPYDKNCLKKSQWGIYEPTTESKIDLACIDLIILPALAADKTGARLGYGKGFYDKILKKIKKNAQKIILISEELLIEGIPQEKHDEKCDLIITQKGIYKTT